MTEGKKISLIIKEDLHRFKQLLNKNPHTLIHNILTSITLKTSKKLSAYQIDIGLAYLKQFYEKIFPETKRGGYLKRVKRILQNEVISDPKSLIYVPPTANNKSYTVNVNHSYSRALIQSIPIPARPTIISLLEGAEIVGKIPSFVQIIASRVQMDKRTIYKYLTRGNYILQLKIPKDIILRYRAGKVSSKIILKEIKLKKKEKGENNGS